ncbi:MAG: nucleotide exchange factor GrpE [Lachnospiraceae bacterium]|nr:nucleotide exchange factor GrpE [Lachnospiraceae bacterium]
MTEEELREETGQEEKTEETVEEKTETEEPVQEDAEETVEGTVEDQPKEEEKPQTDERDAKIEELNGRYLRLMAEFDNYRKRTEKEKLQQYDLGVSGTVAKLLPMVDSFDRGLLSVKDSDPDSPVVAGMELIYKQLQKAFDEIGVEAMNAEGKEFDPNFHNAVIQVENEDLESGTVASELIKGYLYKGKVVRPATVSVVQ